MEERVIRLEEWAKHSDQRMVRMEGLLERIDERLGRMEKDLPTKNDLWSWKLQWTGLCVAAIALIIGGIIGGLSWIKPDAPAAIPAPPVTITAPPPQIIYMTPPGQLQQPPQP
ncbi:hypothetical protein [Azospirillum argentinense]|uniref:hypothetical protein n=1 Tax=Azospirillum argentinense TaxID=2970906 RepID=UPI0032DFECD5